MDQRGALAQLFLAGRSPEEQQALILKQRHDAGLSGSGGAFPSGPPGNAFPPGTGAGGADMTQAGPWGAGQEPVAATDPLKTASVVANAAPSSAPIPAPRPDQPYIPSIITGGAGPGQDPSVPIPAPRPDPASALVGPSDRAPPILPQEAPVPVPRPIEAMGALPQEGPIPQLRALPQNAPIPKPRPKKGKDGSLKKAAKKAGVSSQYALF